MNYIMRCFRHWLHNRDMELINSIWVGEVCGDTYIENIVSLAIVQRGDNMKRTYLTDSERHDAINFLKSLEVK